MERDTEKFDGRQLRRLWYAEKVDKRGRQFLLWRGNAFVGVVASLEEAESICRSDQGMRRLASDRTSDLRRHQIEKSRHSQEVDVLVDTLQKVNTVLRSGKERELLKAKQEAAVILRKFARIRATLQHPRSAGFTLLEALTVLVLAFLLLTLSASAISQGIRATRIRVASEQLTMDLRLARLTAVTKGAAIDFIVSADPVNSYEYTDALGKTHSAAMPPGVRLTGSPTLIQFLPNGSVLGGATTVLEVFVTDSILERRTIATSVLGVPRLTVARLGS